MNLIDQLRASCDTRPPFPGEGNTEARHRFLFDLGRDNLSLARLAEAHWDAVAILKEAGRSPVPNAIYGVWAAEIPNRPMTLSADRLSGSKPFCSGGGLIDRALITVTDPIHRLIDVDVRPCNTLVFDSSNWHSSAFAETATATAIFDSHPVAASDVVGDEGFYLSRPGFWNGACGPACCWAGGAAGLVDWALKQKRNDPHTLAHLGAMRASLWLLENLLDAAGREIDANPRDNSASQTRALMFRHLVEMHSTDILRRLARAYGPHPLAMEKDIARRYAELDLYLRQSHAERDLEVLGRQLK